VDIVGTTLCEGGAAEVHSLFRECMAYVGEVPWHGLGHRVPASAQSSEFIKAAGLDWPVELVPAPGAKALKNGKFDRRLVQRPARSGEHGPVALAMVGSRYVPLQNTEAFEFFDPLLRTGWAALEAAGALGDGETAWVQAKLQDDINLRNGDVIQRYLLLRNRHNGEGAISIRFTPIRVVCQNTLTLSEKRQVAFANVRHVSGVRDKLTSVQADVLQQEVEKFSDRTSRMFAAMVDLRLSGSFRLRLLDKLCGPIRESEKRKLPQTRVASAEVVEIPILIGV
jgi:phage/plasmid-like protein (TIGR03299 family)